MNNRLYKLMNWPEIEEILYSDGDNPHRILGAHKVGANFLIQAYFPGAKEVYVLVKSRGRAERAVKMEMADEAGFFALLLPSKEVPVYRYRVVTEDDTVKETDDPYRFAPLMGREDSIKFNSGLHYHIYEKMGAHIKVRDGVSGAEFAVWAPDAARVSVIGEFNDWDGRTHQMQRVDPDGLFEIFVPGAVSGDAYQFEIKTRSGEIFTRTDPYARMIAEGDASIAVITEEAGYVWDDDKWLRARRKFDRDEDALSICELSIDSFVKKSGGEHVTYRQLAGDAISFAKDHGFKTIELHPVMEHIKGHSYHILGMYALDRRFGTADDFSYFIDQMHSEGIRVILDWVPTFFPAVNGGLMRYDGRSLYEYSDPRLGIQPRTGDLIYDFGRGQVVNFLISSALYWLDTFHADGLRLPDISKILYLDYDRTPGQWIPNMYGGNENLEALEFIKHLNSVVRKKDPGILMLTKETACWPQVTENLAGGGLGFDYKWNNGWTKDFLDYIHNDPLFRAGFHSELTFSLIYCYTERFVLAFTHEDVADGLQGLYELMPGDSFQKMAGVRLSIAYLYTHPGKKLLYMEPGALTMDNAAFMENMLKAVNTLVEEKPALHVLDSSENGFEWINSMAADECMMTFVRKGYKDSDMLLIVVNMAGVEREFEVGVPADGRYQEIFNTDDESFGGSGILNPGRIEAVFRELDGRPYCIPVHLAATSLVIFSYTPYTAKEKKIRKIREEEALSREKEREKTRKNLELRHMKEEERLIAQLRLKYEREMAAQNEAIDRKYEQIEKERIEEVESKSASQKKRRGTK